MYRFTTPIHTFKFPDSFDPTELADILITYSQRGTIKLEKHLSDLAAGDNNTMFFRLSQEESAKFMPGVLADVQVRILFATGESFASSIKKVEVLPVLHEGVLGSV